MPEDAAAFDEAVDALINLHLRLPGCLCTHVCS
jgi:hypothetical protein